MNLNKSEYEEICRNLGVPSYADDDEDRKDIRLWNSEDILVLMSRQIKYLKKDEKNVAN